MSGTSNLPRSYCELLSEQQQQLTVASSELRCYRPLPGQEARPPDSFLCPDWFLVLTYVSADESQQDGGQHERRRQQQAAQQQKQQGGRGWRLRVCGGQQSDRHGGRVVDGAGAHLGPPASSAETSPSPRPRRRRTLRRRLRRCGAAARRRRLGPPRRRLCRRCWRRRSWCSCGGTCRPGLRPVLGGQHGRGCPAAPSPLRHKEACH